MNAVALAILMVVTIATGARADGPDAPPPYIAHVEIPADRPEAVAAFYAELFGWTFDIYPDETGKPGYWLAPAGNREAAVTAGVAARTAATSAPVFTVYVPDIDVSLRQLASLGGSISVAKFAVPGNGWLAYVTDPDGNPFAIYEVDPKAAD